MPRRETIWTIGHSTRPIEDLIALLKSHGIQRLVDVRTIPRSRHNPQFNSETLAASLVAAGLSYQHSARLGGLRKVSKDSVNQGWRNASFRGYADYMQTEEFQRAVEELTVDSQPQPTTVMCAEALPWRCHRSLIADALIVRGWEVRHIMGVADAEPHQLTSFARVVDDAITYPKSTDPQSVPRLF